MQNNDVDHPRPDDVERQLFYESLFGKGVADPDMVGYPGEEDITFLTNDSLIMSLAKDI